MKQIVRGFLILLAVVLSANLYSQDSLLRENIPDRYIVKKGDTLWDISSLFLKNPWYWPEIWHANQQIDNPHLIFPGDVINLIYVDGKPRLTVNRTVKLQPGTNKLSPQIRELDVTDAIPAIPLEEINSFLSKTRILDEGILEAAPYVIAGQESRLISAVGDRLFARGEFADNIPTYGLYRKGQVYQDPETEEILGVEAIELGSANMRAIEGQVATLSITRSSSDVRLGDRVLPKAERLVETTFFPSKPEMIIDGNIISVENGVTHVGLLDVITLDRGLRDGLDVGNVLSIYKVGEVITDNLAKSRKDRMVKLPDEKSGLAMVFQSFEKMSLAIVLHADRGITVGDSVRNPEE